MRILCVDSDEDTRSLLENLLEYADLEAIAVQGTKTALFLIEKEQFGLYIIDSQMPGVSGPGLCEQIRRFGRKPGKSCQPSGVFRHKLKQPAEDRLR